MGAGTLAISAGLAGSTMGQMSELVHCLLSPDLGEGPGEAELSPRSGIS